MAAPTEPRVALLSLCAGDEQLYVRRDHVTRVNLRRMDATQGLELTIYMSNGLKWLTMEQMGDSGNKIYETLCRLMKRWMQGRTCYLKIVLDRGGMKYKERG